MSGSAMVHTHSWNAACAHCGTVYHVDDLVDCVCGADWLCEGCFDDWHCYNGYASLSFRGIGAVADGLLVACVVIALALCWAYILL